MKTVLVVDAQGGGLGAAIVKKLAEVCGEKIRIVAAGTNVAATSAMNKAGAKECATGENAVCFNARSADVIMGGIGIIASSGMMGEITPRMARCIAESPAKKILIPLSRCNIIVPGFGDQSARALIDLAAGELNSLL
jgi:hypothetical protein